METVEIVVAFLAGLAAAGIVAAIFAKRRGAAAAGINAIVGGCLLALMSAFGFCFAPLNPFNALAVGLLGVPGLAAVCIIALL